MKIIRIAKICVSIIILLLYSERIALSQQDNPNGNTAKDQEASDILGAMGSIDDLSPKKWTQGMVRLLVLGLAVLQTGQGIYNPV